MNKLIQDTETELFFVKGKGFVEEDAAQATQYDNYADADRQLESLKDAGIGADAEVVDAPAPPPVAVEPEGEAIPQNADGSSWEIYYVRPRDLRADGSVVPNAKNPSARRFAKREDAARHGDRFVTIEKHAGFFLKLVQLPATAYINAETGLTNPEIGKARNGADRLAKRG